ncbi:MAG: type II and III secretion system protein family protein [Burkholderiales bacterium]
MTLYADVSWPWRVCLAVGGFTVAVVLSDPARASDAPANKTTPAPRLAGAQKAKASSPETLAFSLEKAPPIQLRAGMSTLIRLQEPAVRMAIGNPEVADVMLIHPHEIYLLGKRAGSTNLFVWTPSGQASVRDVAVGTDLEKLQGNLRALLPQVEGVRVDPMGDSLVLSGRVRDGVKVARIVALTEAFLGSQKVVNLLQVDSPQQVMLEVKVAEVSKSLMEDLGVDLSLQRTISNTQISLLSQLLSAGASTFSIERPNGRTQITVSAEMKKSIIKVLAEPTITAISGQEGSFLAGGRIFIPVPQGGAGGTMTITLEEKEFGVGLRFLPTVLEEGLIHLRVTPEVSELSDVGASITAAGGQTSVLPSITTRRASTTVQLRDGESFAIGGLIKSNQTASIRAVPVLGELPILGALFRSSAFQNQQSELLFIVTPRLARPLPSPPLLPTDVGTMPTRSQFFLEGRLEGDRPPPLEPVQAQPASAPGSGSSLGVSP